jgi:hypothetical protein
VPRSSLAALRRLGRLRASARATLQDAKPVSRTLTVSVAKAKKRGRSRR